MNNNCSLLPRPDTKQSNPSSTLSGDHLLTAADQLGQSLRGPRGDSAHPGLSYKPVSCAHGTWFMGAPHGIPVSPADIRAPSRSVATTMLLLLLPSSWLFGCFRRWHSLGAVMESEVLPKTYTVDMFGPLHFKAPYTYVKGARHPT